MVKSRMGIVLAVLFCGVVAAIGALAISRAHATDPTMVFNGNVGINKSPSGPLDLQPSVASGTNEYFDTSGNLVFEGDSVGYRCLKSTSGFCFEAGPNYSPIMYVRLDTSSSNKGPLVGIGTDNPVRTLDVNGILRLGSFGNAAPVAPTSGGYLYARMDTSHTPNKIRLYALDTNGNETLLTSHLSPAEMMPGAASSFSDSTVAMPFSFTHANSLIGKRQVVDMSKLAAFVEKQMQAQLGPQAGKLVYTQDLPDSEKETPKQYEAQMIDDQVQAVVAAVKYGDWIKVDLGANKTIPPEAVEEAPVTMQVQQKVTVTEDVMDFDSMKIVTKTREDLVLVEQPTGQTKKQLKANWTFRDGNLFRMPTIDDIDLDDYVQPVNLSDWIVNRAPGNKNFKSQAELKAIVRARALRELQGAASQPSGN